MEWNWVGHNYNCSKRLLVRIKLLPLYVLSTAYKCISVSVIVWYLNWYSIPSIGAVGLAMAITDFIIRRNQPKFRKFRRDKQNESDVRSSLTNVNMHVNAKYQCKYAKNNLSYYNGNYRFIM